MIHLDEHGDNNRDLAQSTARAAIGRRALLGATGVGMAAVLAGCSQVEDAETEDDADDENDPTHFAITDFEPGDHTMTVGETFDVSATVENTGEESGEQEVAYRIDDDDVASETLGIVAGGSKTVSFENVETADLEAGEYDHGVYSDDDESTGELTVEDIESEPSFSIESIDPAVYRTDLGETFDLTAEIENVGDAEGTQDVVYEIDGDEVAVEENVTLDVGDSVEVTFEGIETDPYGMAHLDQEVVTEDSWASGLLTIIDPDAETLDPGTEIELDGQTGGWIGIEPEEFEGVENPDLVLAEDEEYGVGWPNEGDGDMHNIAIWNGHGDVVDDLRTGAVTEPDEDQWLEFEASIEMINYVCEPHSITMGGDIFVIE